jgi:hypothetical protein
MLGHKTGSHYVTQTDDPKLIEQAQKLQAKIYHQKGYVQLEEIGPDGRLNVADDPHQNAAIYFVAMDKNKHEVCATARLLRSRTEDSFDGFQLFEHFTIYPNEQRDIRKYNIQDTYEVSALARDQYAPSEAVLELYRGLWQYSVTHNHKLWLISCNADLFRTLRAVFGKSIKPIGHRQLFRHHYFIPAILEIEPSHKYLKAQLKKRPFVLNPLKKRLAAYFLHKP